MQAKNGDIWGAREALSELIKEKLPVKTSYWLAKLARKMGEHTRDIEAVRLRLIDQYGDHDEGGKLRADERNNVVMSDENKTRFATAYNELMDETVELEGLPMEKIALPSDNGLCVTPQHLLALEPFVSVAES